MDHNQFDNPFTQGCIQKMGLRKASVTFQIMGGGGGGQWYNREPMAYNKLRGSVDMFPKEIFELLTI